MKRSLLIPALIAIASRGAAQQLPVVQPRITELGTVIDSTPTGDLMPLTAALSPGGKLIAYATGRGLRVWNIATRSSSIVIDGSIDNEAIWSPAGDALVFGRPDDKGDQVFIWTARVDPKTGRAVGSPQRVSLTPSTGRTAQFSPDGKMIAFSRLDGPRRSSLVVVPATGGAERVLGSGRDVRQITWSNDGSALYYAAYADSAAEAPYHAYRVPLNGGAPKEIYVAAAGAEAPHVGSDGRILVPGPSLPDRSQRTLNDANGKALAMLAFPRDAWVDDADGRRALAVRESRPRALRVVDIATGASRTLIDTTAEANAMGWFPDGQRIAAIVRRKGAYLLTVHSLDGRELKAIPLTVMPMFRSTLDSRFHAQLEVSPDSRYAYYVGVRRSSLELVDLTSGKQRTLAGSSKIVDSPAWRADSRAIRYVRDAATGGTDKTRAVHEVTIDGTDKVVRRLPFAELPGIAAILANYDWLTNFARGATSYQILHLDGSPPRAYPLNVAGGGQISPDGKTIAVRVGDPTLQTRERSARRLTLATLSDLKVRTIDLPFEDGVPIAMQWNHDGKSIFIAGQDSPTDPVNFYSMPIDGGAPRIVARARTKEPGSIFRVSPDGKYIAFFEAGAERATFLSLDFTEGVSRLSPPAKRD